MAKDGSIAATPGNIVGKTCYEHPLATRQMGHRDTQYAHPEFPALDPVSRYMRAYLQRMQVRLSQLARRQLKEEDERIEHQTRDATRHGLNNPDPHVNTTQHSAAPVTALIRPANVKGFDKVAARRFFTTYPGGENGVTACIPFHCHGGCSYREKCIFVHPPGARVVMSAVEFAKFGPAGVAICAVTGGHKSGKSIPPGDRVKESERAWAMLRSSTHSGGEAARQRASTPLSRNPVPAILGEVVIANPHPLQAPLEALIRNDGVDHFKPLPEPRNPAVERFDPKTVLPHEIVGGDTKLFLANYKEFESAFEMVELVFKRLGVWDPPLGTENDRHDYVEDRDKRVRPWMASFVELNTRDARLSSDAAWDVAVVETLRYAVSEGRNTPGITHFANVALRHLNGTRAGGPTDFMGTL